MHDVAKRAGVSTTTVSHVVNQTRPVSEKLRQRVLAAMDELGYEPNRLARSLRRGETHTIGMIVPDNVNPFFAEVARGIEDAGSREGYSVILCNSDGDLEKELFYHNVLTAKRVDGILLVAVGMSTEVIRSLQKRRMPLVIIDREVPDVAADSVLIDNAEGGRQATRHLLDLGHRRIGCITGPSDVTPSAARVTGYRQTLRAAGIAADEALVVRGDFLYESGHRAAHRLLAMDEPPTAIFACNDLMAIGAISAAVSAGWEVPADLSVIGFDDVRLASFANPPLTTIAQPKHEMGVLAVTMLLERMQDYDMPPRRRLLDTDLVVRRSTAPVLVRQTEDRGVSVHA